jgi:hypothetical protein
MSGGASSKRVGDTATGISKMAKLSSGTSAGSQLSIPSLPMVQFTEPRDNLLYQLSSNTATIANMMSGFVAAASNVTSSVLEHHVNKEKHLLSMNDRLDALESKIRTTGARDRLLVSTASVVRSAIAVDVAVMSMIVGFNTQNGYVAWMPTDVYDDDGLRQVVVINTIALFHLCRGASFPGLNFPTTEKAFIDLLSAWVGDNDIQDLKYTYGDVEALLVHTPFAMGVDKYKVGAEKKSSMKVRNTFLVVDVEWLQGKLQDGFEKYADKLRKLKDRMNRQGLVSITFSAASSVVKRESIYVHVDSVSAQPSFGLDWWGECFTPSVRRFFKPIYTKLGLSTEGSESSHIKYCLPVTGAAGKIRNFPAVKEAHFLKDRDDEDDGDDENARENDDDSSEGEEVAMDQGMVEGDDDDDDVDAEMDNLIAAMDDQSEPTT